MIMLAIFSVRADELAAFQELEVVRFSSSRQPSQEIARWIYQVELMASM